MHESLAEIESRKEKRTPAASPHPSGSDGSGGHGSSQVGSARLHLLMQTMLDGGWTPLKPVVGLGSLTTSQTR